MSKYIISYIFLCINIFFLQGQNEQFENIESINTYQTYGIRFGVDLSRILISNFDNQDQGYEIVFDYRVAHKLYVAGEFGYNKKLNNLDYITFRTKGNYAKLGLNINLYENWLDMNNEIFLGLRYGASQFTQHLYSYTIYKYGTYFPGETIRVDKEYRDLYGQWGELILGIKAEIFTNLFLGLSTSFKSLFSSKEPENFKNLHIPGFYRVFQNNSGFSFGYTISYTIPLYKKARKIKISEEKTTES